MTKYLYANNKRKKFIRCFMQLLLDPLKKSLVGLKKFPVPKHRNQRHLPILANPKFFLKTVDCAMNLELNRFLRQCQFIYKLKRSFKNFFLTFERKNFIRCFVNLLPKPLEKSLAVQARLKRFPVLKHCYQRHLSTLATRKIFKKQLTVQQRYSWTDFKGCANSFINLSDHFKKNFYF